MLTMETATETDRLKALAGNIWFVLGAYFLAFFPWMIIHNIDFISEKWRTCRRTRKLAHYHLASSILPIIYVAVYAEAQRRDGDSKELGAALAALMFNVFQLMRTIMGWVQLNAFVAWCKDAVECIRALEEYDGLRWRPERGEGRSKAWWRGMIETVGQWKNVIVSWCKGCWQRMRRILWRGDETVSEGGDGDGENREASVAVNMEENDLEDVVMVNNMVVDNELGGREVTVSPSWEKIWRGVKEGRFTPSKWLRTDRAILNTVRWGGAYLCGMGEGWSVDRWAILPAKEIGEILETFFSREMENVLNILQRVEWDMNVENNGRELFSVYPANTDDSDDDDDVVLLTGEMSAAYGNRDTSYGVGDTYTVEAYSFEFNSLVGSYPGINERYISANRERIVVGLVHSVLVAKHLGIEKLRAIRRYYDGHRVPEGTILRTAFKLLLMQMCTRISDDSKIWEMFTPEVYQIPIFPYRMQMVGLWDEGTNWRVLQASARRDIFNSRICAIVMGVDNAKRILDNAPYPVNIFDYCAKWTIEQISRTRPDWKGSLGVVMETVRTFLAEWITASGREPNWEPEIPTSYVEFHTREKLGFYDRTYITWICQRELQKKVAQMSREDENFSGDASLIMLFILGFPLLQMDNAQDGEVDAQSSEEAVQKASGSSPASTHRRIDLSNVWRAWTDLSPQDISVIIRIDSDSGTLSLRLENNSGDTCFKWEDWVNAALGCLKGFEEAVGGEKSYGRKIMRADLRKPMVELCPLRAQDYRTEKPVKKTCTARV